MRSAQWASPVSPAQRPERHRGAAVAVGAKTGAPRRDRQILETRILASIPAPVLARVPAQAEPGDAAFEANSWPDVEMAVQQQAVGPMALAAEQ
jgi:hypothetical protein